MNILSKVYFEHTAENYLVIMNIDRLNPIDMNIVIEEIYSSQDHFRYMNAKVIILTKYKHLLTHSFAIFNQEKPTGLNSVCITNSKRVVQHLSYYDKNLSIMFSEVVRNLNAITIIEKKGVLCPANWYPGENVINPKEWAVLEKKLGTVY